MQLDKLLSCVSDDAQLRVNGETVTELTLTWHNPLASEHRSNSEMEQLVHDKVRDQVLDISVNGRESPKLPVVRRDMRVW